MKRILSVVLILAFMFNLGIFPLLSAEETLADELPKMKVTLEQLEALKVQPGIRFSPTAPLPGPREIVICIDDSLGGGYLVGTPEAFSAALYTTGITPELLDPLTLIRGEFARGFALTAVGGVPPWWLLTGGAVAFAAYLLSTPTTPTEH